jgi:hypothetical protein
MCSKHVLLMHEIKDEVILRILAQESPKSELWLRRYGERSFMDLFGISEKWLGLYLEYIQILGFCLEVCALRLDFG